MAWAVAVLAAALALHTMGALYLPRVGGDVPREVPMITRVLMGSIVWSAGISVVMLVSSAVRWGGRKLGIDSTTTLVLNVVVAATTGALLALSPPPPFLFPHRGGQARLHPPPAATLLAVGCLWGVVHCGTWALAFIVPAAAERERLRALEARQLRTSAELAHLRAQLEPHFLRNTLNLIAGLVIQDPREARRLLGALGDLLSDGPGDESELQSLGAEVCWLRRYAEILEARHVGIVRFQWDIAPEAHAVLVPRLLLQPLVENAVKHGALAREDGEDRGLVRVCAHVVRDEDASKSKRRLVCTVEDTGPGMNGSAPRPGGFGLQSVRRRLELRNDGARLRIESSSHGTKAIVELPVHETDADTSPVA